MRQVIDLTGKTFGIMTVLGKDESAPKGSGCKSHWIVLCRCGVERSIRSDVLRHHKQQSCGCLKGTNNPRATGLPKQMFQRWINMMRRCYSPSEKDAKNYKDRGIIVSPEWHDPRKFYEDMGDPPFEGATLDRINNDLGYWKANCRWATRSMQNKNRRPFKIGEKNAVLQ